MSKSDRTNPLIRQAGACNRTAAHANPADPFAESDTTWAEINHVVFSDGPAPPLPSPPLPFPPPPSLLRRSPASYYLIIWRVAWRLA